MYLPISLFIHLFIYQLRQGGGGGVRDRYTVLGGIEGGGVVVEGSLCYIHCGRDNDSSAESPL